MKCSQCGHDNPEVAQFCGKCGASLIESANWIESEQATDAYTNLGLAYIELGQYQKAINHFDKVLKIAPNYSEAIRGKKTAEDLKQK